MPARRAASAGRTRPFSASSNVFGADRLSSSLGPGGLAGRNRPSSAIGARSPGAGAGPSTAWGDGVTAEVQGWLPLLAGSGNASSTRRRALCCVHAHAEPTYTPAKRVHAQALAGAKGKEQLAEDVVALREQVSLLKEHLVSAPTHTQSRTVCVELRVISGKQSVSASHEDDGPGLRACPPNLARRTRKRPRSAAPRPSWCAPSRACSRARSCSTTRSACWGPTCERGAPAASLMHSTPTRPLPAGPLPRPACPPLASAPPTPTSAGASASCTARPTRPSWWPTSRRRWWSTAPPTRAWRPSSSRCKSRCAPPRCRSCRPSCSPPTRSSTGSRASRRSPPAAWQRQRPTRSPPRPPPRRCARAHKGGCWRHT